MYDLPFPFPGLPLSGELVYLRLKQGNLLSIALLLDLQIFGVLLLTLT